MTTLKNSERSKWIDTNDSLRAEIDQVKLELRHSRSQVSQLEMEKSTIEQLLQSETNLLQRTIQSLKEELITSGKHGTTFNT